MSSDKKIAANRTNGRKSHGPINTTSTRFNATRHGLLAMGITELDDAEGYRALLNHLREEKQPCGIVETELVESIALDMIRRRRARGTSELNPPLRESDVIPRGMFEGARVDPGLPASLSFDSVLRLIIFQRYEMNFENRMSRNLHELERQQRMRDGQRLPAPSIVDVTVHAAESTLPEAEESPLTLENSVPVLDKPNSLSGDVDVDMQAETGEVDSLPEDFEQPKNMPGETNERRLPNEPN